MGQGWTGAPGPSGSRARTPSGTDSSPTDHPHPDGVTSRCPETSPRGQRSCTATECGACSLDSVSLTYLQRPEAGATFVGSDSPVPSTVLVPKMLVDGRL